MLTLTAAGLLQARDAKEWITKLHGLSSEQATTNAVYKNISVDLTTSKFCKNFIL